ncbi:hypothetical protein EBU99_01330 [bacterium]|nr:hypothetical protein [bacterium]
MSLKNSSLRLRQFAPAVTSLGLLFIGLSCGTGSKSSDDAAQAAATAKPTVTETPETAAVPFWIASGSFAVRFDASGNSSLPVDVVRYGVDLGTISALHFLDANTLLFFVDTGNDSSGAAKEKIFGTLDPKTGLVKNRAWGAVSSIKTTFKSAPAGSMFSGFQSGVLNVQTEAGIKAVRFNADGGTIANDFYSASSAADCPMDKLSGIALIQGGGASQIIAMSYGTQSRLNILGLEAGVVTCKSSLDYSSGSTTSVHKPVNVVQMPDGKVYVLFQHDTTKDADSNPKIMRYDFDGKTLSNGSEFYKGFNNLGKKPFGMIARTSKKLLVARPDAPALIEIAIKGNDGEQTDFYQLTGYANNLTALIPEPL